MGIRMRTLGFGYVCNGCGFSGIEPSWSQTWGYDFKKLDEVVTLGEATTYIYNRWKQAKDIPAARQAVEKYEEAYEKFEKQRIAQKLILSQSVTYLSNWPEVKKLLNGAWEIRVMAENIGKEKEPSGKAPTEPPKNGKKKEEVKQEPGVTVVTDLKPPPDEGKPFPWWMVGVGAVGIGVVVLLLGMRKKATANFNPRYSPGVGQYIREEMHKIGKSPHVQSRSQAIKVGLERARRAGLKVPRRNSVL